MAKVLQLLHSDEKAGVELLADLIGKDLATAGADVETLFLYPAFSAGRLAKLKGLLLGAWQIIRFRPDMLVTYQPTASVLAGLLGRVIGCRRRVVHQTAKPSAMHPVSRRLDRFIGGRGFYTANIANSTATLAEFADYPAAYRAGLRLIEHGVSPPRPRFSRQTTLARFGVPDDGAILLNAGRLIEQKGQHRIIQLLTRLPAMRLVLAGGGPLEAEYRALAATLKVAARVHFLGFLPRAEVGDLLGAADVFVFPSVWETFGLAAVEAGMLGVPVVCSDLAVFREVLSVNGSSVASFVAPDDQAAMAQAVAAALAASARQQARDFAPGLAAKYSEDRMLAAYRAMLWPAGSAERADKM